MAFGMGLNKNRHGTYEARKKVPKGLKDLGLVSHRKGQTRFRKMEFDPGDFFSVALLGRASRFSATGKLLRLAGHYGIGSGNVREHFAPEPPMFPLVLKDYAGGRGRKKAKGRRINFKHTAETRRLEEDKLLKAHGTNAPQSVHNTRGGHSLSRGFTPRF